MGENSGRVTVGYRKWRGYVGEEKDDCFRVRGGRRGGGGGWRVRSEEEEGE